MEKNNLLQLFGQFRQCLQSIVEFDSWQGFESGITEDEYLEFRTLVNKEFQFNPWFTKENYYLGLKGLIHLLEPTKLKRFANEYSFSSSPKKVAIIMAGNIPFVGFHDLLCVLLSGNKALVKLSSSDARIPLHLIGWLLQWSPELKDSIEFAAGPVKNYNAVIATGSNNTIQQLQSYFQHVPALLRQNRTSVAVLDGSETNQELHDLANDCFQFFGMGCRNVSKLYLPEGFDTNRIFENALHFGHLIQHHKYGNNYDYYRTIYLMNQIEFLDNNVFMLKEDAGLHAPLSVIYYEYYKDIKLVKQHIEKCSNEIQAVIGHGLIPFGKAQSPEIDDFADNIDTIKWLNNI